MTGDTVPRNKGFMADRIEQVRFRAAMGVVTAHAGIGTRLDAGMGRHKIRALIVTPCTQRSNRRHSERGKIRSMRAVAGTAAFCGRLVQGTVTPELSDLGMTAQAQSGLSPAQITLMGRAMAGMTGRTLLFSHRLMGIAVLGNGRLNIAVAVHADRTGLALHQTGLIGTMRPMTEQAVAFNKRRMGFILGLGGLKVRVATEAHFAAAGCFSQQLPIGTAVGIVTTGTLAPRERTMLAEQTHFTARLAMTGETQVRFTLGQQLQICRLVRDMTFAAQTLLSRVMGIARRSKDLGVMAIIAELRGLLGQQIIQGRGVTLVTGHAVALAHRRMNAADPEAAFGLIVTVQTHPGGRLVEHAGIFAGMSGMAGLAVA